MAVVEKLRLVVLASGGGSTAEAIYNAIQRRTQYGHLPRTEFAGLITDTEEAGARRRLENLGLSPAKMRVVSPKEHSDDFGEALNLALGSLNADTLGQYGWDVITPKLVIDKYKDRMINQHGGAVNPDEFDFGGDGMSNPKRFHLARLIFVNMTQRNFRQWVVAQRVDERVDKGPVLKRREVPIEEDDTVDSLQDRAIEKEWEVQIKTLNDFEDGTVKELGPIPNLVRPEEKDVLFFSKAVACAIYSYKGIKRGEPKLEPVCDQYGISESHIHSLVGRFIPS